MTVSITALKKKLRKKNTTSKEELEEEFKKSISFLKEKDRALALSKYEQLKKTCSKHDDEAFDFFDLQIEVLGEKYRPHALGVLEKRLKENLGYLKKFKQKTTRR